VSEVAKRGLEAREKYGRGGTLVGARRANQLANREVVSIETIKRMTAYFDRHAIDLEAPAAKPGHPDYPSAGRIAWDLWGGAPGRAWARHQLTVWERVQREEGN
jgi:transposase